MCSSSASQLKTLVQKQMLTCLSRKYFLRSERNGYWNITCLGSPISRLLLLFQNHLWPAHLTLFKIHNKCLIKLNYLLTHSGWNFRTFFLQKNSSNYREMFKTTHLTVFKIHNKCLITVIWKSHFNFCIFHHFLSFLNWLVW